MTESIDVKVVRLREPIRLVCIAYRNATQQDNQTFRKAEDDLLAALRTELAQKD